MNLLIVLLGYIILGIIQVYILNFKIKVVLLQSIGLGNTFVDIQLIK